MNSIWSETVKIDERPILEKDLSVDTAVIGAGMAGVLTAFLLQENGIETVVIEADRIGGGQTKNTTAKITAQHGVTYDRLIKDLGEKKAKQYAYANMQAIEEYGRIIKKYGLECQFEERPAYLYTKLSPEILRQEAEAARNLGIDAHFTTETELPFSIAGALRFNGQAVFHPLEFLKGLAERLTVYEHTKALSVQDDEIITDRGKVKAKHIVFATHFPIINVPGYYFAKMHQGRSYVIALENTPPMKGMYYGIDPDGLSFRPADEIMLLGGGGHKTGENYLGGKYSMLRAKAAEFWPQSREAACWSAQDCMTPDGIPYIGRYSRSRPDWYICSGFNKWGMTNSMIAALLISAKITGKRHPSAPVYSPQRLTTPPAAKSMLKNGIQAAKGVGKELFFIPTENARDIPKGHGGIVEYEGKKYGIYKDEEGRSFVVDIRCPHMGCQLEWNPDEKSWDCPCHGSRFDYQGRILDNPAQESIEGKMLS